MTFNQRIQRLLSSTSNLSPLSLSSICLFGISLYQDIGVLAPRWGRKKVYLPMELERHIFEMALLDRPKNALNLLLVAHRCRVWLEPLFYHTVVLNTSSKAVRFLSCTSNRPDGFLSQNVHSLLVRLDDLFLHPVLLTSLCSSSNSILPSTPILQRLIILPGTRTNSTLQPLIQNPAHRFPKLTHLSIPLDASFGTTHLDFSAKAIFENVTHLQVHNPLVRSPAAWDGIACQARGAAAGNDNEPTSRAKNGYLPNLTHLSMSGLGLSTVSHVLEICPRLRCLVFERHPDQLVDIQIEDSRFVVGVGTTSGSDHGAVKRDPSAGELAGPFAGMSESGRFGMAEEIEYWGAAELLVEKQMKVRAST